MTHKRTPSFQPTTGIVAITEVVENTMVKVARIPVITLSVAIIKSGSARDSPITTPDREDRTRF